MPVEFRNGQHIFWGTGSLAQLPLSIAKNGNDGFILVRGRTSFQTVDQALDSSWKQHMIKEIIIEQKVPDWEALNKIYADIAASFPKSFVAIGGGVVMDSAKTLIYLAEKVGKNIPELIAVPTTAGSGSEATPFAVIYEGRNKKSLESPALLPSTVLLDTITTGSLPMMQRATSGIDAWCQSIESCWSNRATEESIRMADKAFHRITEELPQTEKPVSLKLMLGAFYAGCAIRTTYTTGAHALSYYLTAEHGIAHGQAVAAFLPVMFRYNMRGESKYAGVDRVLKWLDASDENTAIKKVVDFIRSCGLKPSLKELALAGLSSHSLVDSINHQRFSNNPRPFDRDALLESIDWSLNQDI